MGVANLAGKPFQIDSAAETASVKVFWLEEWFIASAQTLASKGYKIGLHKKYLAKGWLIWIK